ncbi:MAG: hypothetical protein KF842_05205 [Caulobacter sp.]|nr:hypothetical protein [Caulobacter sp.]
MNDVPPPFRSRFNNDDYVNSFVSEGSAAQDRRPGQPGAMPARGGAATVLAAVHLPTSLWVVGETLNPAAGLSHSAVSHIEVAGLAILAVSAAVAAAELCRQGLITYVQLVDAVGKVARRK